MEHRLLVAQLALVHPEGHRVELRGQPLERAVLRTPLEALEVERPEVLLPPLVEALAPQPAAIDDRHLREQVEHAFGRGRAVQAPHDRHLGRVLLHLFVTRRLGVLQLADLVEDPQVERALARRPHIADPHQVLVAGDMQAARGIARAHLLVHFGVVHLVLLELGLQFAPLEHVVHLGYPPFGGGDLPPQDTAVAIDTLGPARRLATPLDDLGIRQVLPLGALLRPHHLRHAQRRKHQWPLHMAVTHQFERGRPPDHRLACPDRQQGERGIVFVQIVDGVLLVAEQFSFLAQSRSPSRASFQTRLRCR